MAGGWKRKKWVFGMLGLKDRGQRTMPVLRLVARRTKRELVPLILHHVRTGSTILSDEWGAYRQALPPFGYKHYTVNHSVAYVNAETGCHTQHIERAWTSYKETIGRLRGNRTEDLLRDHLIVIEWNEWLGKKHHNGPLGRSTILLSNRNRNKLCQVSGACDVNGFVSFIVNVVSKVPLPHYLDYCILYAKFLY